LDVVVVTLNASAAYRGRDGSKDQIEEDAARRVLQCMSPLLALSGHARRVGRCPLSGAKRTWLKDGDMSAYDPIRTFGLRRPAANPERTAVIVLILSFGV